VSSHEITKSKGEKKRGKKKTEKKKTRKGKPYQATNESILMDKPPLSTNPSAKKISRNVQERIR